MRKEVIGNATLYLGDCLPFMRSCADGQFDVAIVDPPYAVGAKTIHPNQKPVRLYEWLLKTYCQAGQTILDTHLGSGSTAIATNSLGFALTATELHEGYYLRSLERIENAKRQERLFA